MYKGQGIMKTIIPVEHKQNNASNKTQANKNVKAHTFHKTDEMLSEEDGAQHCGLGRPDAAEIFVTERYQQEHRIWARQTCEGTEQCSDPPVTAPYIVKAEDGEAKKHGLGISGA